MKYYLESVRRVFEGEAPCDRCKQQNDCKKFELACRAFSYYVLHGTFHEHTPRHPTHGLFNKIFKEDDKALKNYLKSVKSREEMAINDLFEE